MITTAQVLAESPLQFKDWFPWVISGLALALSATAVGLNRRANEMKALDRQAYFTASWTQHPNVPQTYLRVTNVGDARAEHVTALLDVDPARLHGLAGHIPGILDKGDSGLFQFLADPSVIQKVTRDPGHTFVIEWTDHNQHVRRQRISGKLVAADPLDSWQNEWPQSVGGHLETDLPDPTVVRATLRTGRKWRVRTPHSS